MNKQPQIPHRPMIARSCPSTSNAHDRRGRRRNNFIRWLSIAAVLLASGHALSAQDEANALFIDEKGNLTIGTTTFIFQSGNVGIVTMQPNSTLDVRGRIYAQQLAFTDADGNWYPDNWIGMADNIGEKTPWLMIGGITDNRKKENNATGSVDGDGKRRIALWADTTKVSGELNVQGAINGEKPPLVFEVGEKGDVAKWHAVDQDIGPLCGDADGCTMKFMLRVNSTDQIRTISEQMYIEQPDKSSNKRPGLQGYTRQLGGGETEFVLQTTATNELVPYPWTWIYVRNYSDGNASPASNAYSGY